MRITHATLSNGCTTSFLTWPRALCPPTAVSPIRNRLAAGVAIATSSSRRFISQTPSYNDTSSFPFESHSQPQRPEPSLSRRPRKDRQLADIVPGDLGATLEAHRRSNQRWLIRPIYKDVRIRKYLANHTNDSRSSQNQLPISKDSALSDSVASTSAPPLPSKVADGIREPQTEGPSPVKLHYIKLKTRRLKGRNLTKDGIPRRPRHYSVDGPPARVWQSMESLVTTDRRDKLNTEVQNFADWMTLSPEETDFRETLSSYLCTALENSVDEASHFQVFGSQLSGLATPVSDIDLKFSIKSLDQAHDQRGPSHGLGRPQNRRLVKNTLHKLELSLALLKKFGGFQSIYVARVPLMKFQHLESRVEVQLVYGNDQLPVTDQVLAYLSEYPQLRPVYLLIKAALDAEFLGDAREGGLGSFPLLMMILASFKHTKLSRRDDLLEALLRFLSFYDGLDTTKSCVSVDPPELFRKRNPSHVLSLQEKQAATTDPLLYAKHRLGVANEEKPWTLCLQDPTDVLNDLGVRCYKYLEVKSMLSRFATLIRSWLEGDILVRNQLESPISAFFGNKLGAIIESRDQFRDFYTSSSGKDQLARMRRFVEAQNLPALKEPSSVEHLDSWPSGNASVVGEVFSKAYHAEQQVYATIAELGKIVGERDAE